LHLTTLYARNILVDQP